MKKGDALLSILAISSFDFLDTCSSDGAPDGMT